MEFLAEREELVPEAIDFVCQLYSVKTTRDGGSRITLDCGAESLRAIQRIQTLNSKGDISLAIACVPYLEPF